MRDLHADSDFTYEQFKPAGDDIALPVTLPTGTIFVSSVNGITGSITFAGGTTGLTFTPAGATISLGGTLAVANGGTGTTTSTGTGSVVLGTSPTLTTPNIVGTSTNDSAAAGSVGEIISATTTSGSAVALTTAVAANVATIALTAGDWDVEAISYYVLGATTNVTILTSSVSTTSATLDLAAGRFMQVSFGTAGLVHGAISITGGASTRIRISLAASDDIHLVARANFTVSTCAAWGTITARRVR